MRRHYNNSGTACSVVGELLNRESKVTLDIQDETVNHYLRLDETSADEQVLSPMAAREKMIARLEAGLERVMKSVGKPTEEMDRLSQSS